MQCLLVQRVLVSATKTTLKMSRLLHEPTNIMRYYSECQTLRKIYNLELNKGKVIRIRNLLKTTFKKRVEKMVY